MPPSFSGKSGFTLVEVLIALSIVSMVLVISTSLFINNYRVAQQASVENVLLEDARFIMSRLTDLIQNNQIDYEEYFSNRVVQANTDPSDRLYGINHGLYEWQFVDGGTDRPLQDPGVQPDGFGQLCQTEANEYVRFPNEDCGENAPLPFSFDEPTGVNPDQTRVDQQALSDDTISNTNSICNANYLAKVTDQINNTGQDCSENTLAEHYRQSELYLVSSEAEQKFIVKAKEVDDNHQALSLVELVRHATNPNTATDVYTCANGYVCPEVNNPDLGNPRLPTYTNNRGLYEDFLPITPLRTHVSDIQFIISPLEDPNLAFAEDATRIRTQPQVTILLTVEPAPAIRSIFTRENVALQVQSTITIREES